MKSNQEIAKTYLNTAILAGQIMLECNAESYRVEDTMVHILKSSNYQTCEAYALATGIFVTLSDPCIETLTMVKRVKSQQTNLNKISLVNDISRQLSNHLLPINEAYQQLSNIENSTEYSEGLSMVSLMVMCASFSILFGGGLHEFMTTLAFSIIFVLYKYLQKHWGFETFVYNVLSLMTAASLIVLFQKTNILTFKPGIVITALMMPAVPGTALTNAIRDTFRGDFSSGSARILESFLIALSIALGVTLGLMMTSGWGYL